MSKNELAELRVLLERAFVKLEELEELEELEDCLRARAHKYTKNCKAERVSRPEAVRISLDVYHFMREKELTTTYLGNLLDVHRTVIHRRLLCKTLWTVREVEILKEIGALS